MPRLWQVIRNTIPELARGDDGRNRAANLSPADKDALVRHQLASVNCMHLNSAALIVGGVCESQRTAEKTLKLLRQHAYVLEEPADDQRPSTTSRSITTAFTIPSLSVANLPAGLTVNTVFVDKNLPGRLAHLSTDAQRRLVRLLYFWEEECRRWQRLVEEEEDLDMSLSVTPAVKGDHRLQLLERVRRQRRLLPSERAGNERETTEGTTRAGPSSGPSSSRTARTPAYEDEPPPPYPGL